MEKEEYAIFRALEHSKLITFGAKMNIYTDNANILYSNQVNSRRILRWRYTYNDHDFSIQHIRGKDNSAADFLSRIYVILNDVNFSEAYNCEELYKWQNTDNDFILKHSYSTFTYQG